MNRILIVRLGSLGDIVHTLPVAAAIRRAFPRARIDWLVSARQRQILDLVPVIDRRLVLGASAGSSASGDHPDDAAFAGAGGVLEAIRFLRQARYDVALDLQGLLKSAVLARASGAGRVIGFSTRYLRERLARPFYTEVHEPAGARHVIEKNLSMLEPLGIRQFKVEFPLDTTVSDVVREVREKTGTGPEGRFVLLNPGAAWPNKRWPPERLGAVAAGLRDRHALPSVVVWGPGEESLAGTVVGASAGAAVLAPRTRIGDLVALTRAAALIVSGDTGPLHIATAVGTPIVGLYGPTSAARNGPWAAADVTVSRTALCGCHDKRRCRRPTPCLLDVPVDEVLDAVARRLENLSTHA
ncbi:MAG TPA: glycosyltransferase family 9 protein [Vicinamibacterales bacterium]|nr:glycosyltransferase family 9 protein [Vicinamibacterales bacterium]